MPRSRSVHPLVHPSRLDRHGTNAPLEPCSQFLYPTSKAIPTMAHGGLIGYASALAAEEKPDAVRKVPSVENNRPRADAGVAARHCCGAREAGRLKEAFAFVDDVFGLMKADLMSLPAMVMVI